MITLDTHATIWWTQAPEHLSLPAADAIRQADRILIPAIVFWEVSLLVHKGRLQLNDNQPVGAWAQQVLAIPRVQEIPLTSRIALAADAADMHPDPADRFIATTAHQLDAPLVTKDRLLRDLPWPATTW